MAAEWLSLETTGRLLSQLKTMHWLSNENGEARKSGQLFNTSTSTNEKRKRVRPSTAASGSTQRHRRVRQGKKAGCSLYLNELLIQKCKLNSDIVLPSIVSLERLSPKGSNHLDGYRHEWHTCSERSYRITDVECIARAKTLQLNLTGMVRWLEVRNCARKSFYVLARRIYLFWCSSVRLRKPYSSLKTVGKTTCRFLA